MAENDKRVKEIISLNVDELDVEELEHRVELATADYHKMCYINCGCDGYDPGTGGGGGDPPPTCDFLGCDTKAIE